MNETQYESKLTPIPRVPKPVFYAVMDILKGVWNGQRVGWDFYRDRDEMRELLVQYATNLLAVLEIEQESQLRMRLHQMREMEELLPTLGKEVAYAWKRRNELEGSLEGALRQQKQLHQLQARSSALTTKIHRAEQDIAAKAERLQKLQAICQQLANIESPEEPNGEEESS